MKSKLSIVIAMFLFVASSCTNAQNGSDLLDAKDFSAKIHENPGSSVIDVRTQSEYAEGSIAGSLNIDWNGDDFDTKITFLDKTKPVFVYCLSGGRSSSAASHMRRNGFTQVYELKGGIMKWRAAGLPESEGNVAYSKGMSLEDFKHLVTSEKLVLVDYYADWCAPCKKMKPFLEEIEKEMSEKVKVVRINVEENKSLCKDLGIEVLPTLEVYKSGSVIWKDTGYKSKEEIESRLR